MGNIEFKDLNKYLTNYFIKQNQITEETEFEIFDIPAIELFNSSRIDLVAKYLYVKNYVEHNKCSFYYDMYCNHIDAFSEGKFVEEGTETKNSLKKYVDSFNDLIDSIKKDGFSSNISLVPTGDDNIILDGAHRVSTAAYFGQTVKVIKFKGLRRNYNINYFKERLLLPIYQDEIIRNYSDVKKDLLTFFVWPTVYNNEKYSQVFNIITEKMSIVYTKEIELNYNGYRNLMIQLYRNHAWLGTVDDHFDGVSEQLNNCYKEGGKLTIIFVENTNVELMLEVKKNIRDLFGIGNYSIHSTDNYEETKIVTDLLLNENSIYFLNYGHPDCYVDYYHKLNDFKKELDEDKISYDDILIDSSSVMSMYGLRESNDIDFLGVEKNYKNANSHEENLKYYDLSKDELVYNPKCYFIYNEIKFMILENVLASKIKRNEEKDKLDVKVINSFLKNKKISKFNKELLIIEFNRRKRVYIYKCRQFGKKTLKLLGIHKYYRMIIDRRNKHE